MSAAPVMPPPLAEFLDAGGTFEDVSHFEVEDLEVLGAAFDLLAWHPHEADYLADHAARMRRLVMRDMARPHDAVTQASVCASAWCAEVLTHPALTARLEPLLRRALPRENWPQCWR